MSKIIELSRNEGEFLVRLNSKYKKTGIKNKNTIKIVAPDNEESGLVARMGKAEGITNVSTPASTLTSLTISKLAAANVPADANAVKAAANQTALTVTKISDYEYKLSADFSELESYASSVPSQGTHKWVGIVLQTGESTIVGLTWNGYTLTSADVAESTSVSIPAGGIIFWLKMEEGQRTILLGKGTKTTAITFYPVNE